MALADLAAIAPCLLIVMLGLVCMASSKESLSGIRAEGAWVRRHAKQDGCDCFIATDGQTIIESYLPQCQKVAESHCYEVGKLNKLAQCSPIIVFGVRWQVIPPAHSRRNMGTSRADLA